MVNNTAIALVILKNGNLLVYFMFSGSRTKRARYSSLQPKIEIGRAHV